MRDPDRIYSDDNPYNRGYTREQVEAWLIPGNTWEYMPEEGTFPALLKAKWPDLFLKGVRVHGERQIAAIQREIYREELRHKLATTPAEELDDKHRRLQSLWRGWEFLGNTPEEDE